MQIFVLFFAKSGKILCFSATEAPNSRIFHSAKELALDGSCFHRKFTSRLRETYGTIATSKTPYTLAPLLSFLSFQSLKSLWTLETFTTTNFVFEVRAASELVN